jgi:general stress protein 26
MPQENNTENYENLHGVEAVKKLQELVGHESISMFHTDLDGDREHIRPMGVQQVCDQGNFWFFSGRSSTKNRDIAKDPKVILTIANTRRSEYLCVHGNAQILDDRTKKEELWNNLAKAWFPEGVDDPELTILKVTPVEAYYWDTTDGRMMAGIKIAVAAVTGIMNDSGSVEGKLKV